MPDLLDQLRVRLAARTELRRVRGGEGIEDDEGDQADQEQQHDHPEKPADDVAAHGGASARGGPARDGTSTTRHHFLNELKVRSHSPELNLLGTPFMSLDSRPTLLSQIQVRK